MAVTIRAPSSTARASHGRGSSLNVGQNMTFALTISAVTGFAWSLLAVRLMGGRLEDGLRVSFLLAGIAAGIIAGVHTIRTRKKKDGAERIVAVVGCYYLAIVAFWSVWVIAERVRMCVTFGAWTDFDLNDHLNLIWIYLVYGTLPYGVLLIPLCFVNRWLVWRAFSWRAA